jgi:hypothetical protein
MKWHAPTASAVARSMSAIPPMATELVRRNELTLCANRVLMHCSANRQSLFDHVVGASEQRWGHLEAERLGRLEIDDQLEFGRLLHRQICGSRAL